MADVTSASRLRVGLLVDSLVQPAWVERALERVVASGAGSIVAVVRNVPEPPAPARSRLRLWAQNRRHLLHAAYQRFDRWRYATADDPFASRDISTLVRGATVLDVRPRRTRFSDTLDDADVDAIERLELDVLVRLGFRILRGRVLQAARHGVLSYHHGDNRRYRGGPPAFWEVLEGNPVTGTVLQVLSEELDGGRVVQRAYSATNPLSVYRNRHEVFWKSAEHLARVLVRLRECGAAALRDAEEATTALEPYSARLYVAPTNREMARGMLALAGRYVRQHSRAALSTEQWFLAYRFRGGVPDDNRRPELTPFRFHRLVPPRDRFWADPFPMRVDGRYYLLFEEYLFETRRAHIAAVEIGPQGAIGAPVTVLKTDWHLSYPFVFHWRGAWWMVPESADAGRVELYRAIRPPYEWVLERVLLDGSLADCTLAEIGGRWWMFGNRVPPSLSAWDELDLYHAGSPLGPWIPHRRNPIVTDVRCARPAGTPFHTNGAWYRPSQDCSGSYGRAINIQRIDALDTSHYAEQTVARLEPAWWPALTGTHTVNALGPLTVIDARMRRSRWFGS